MIRLCETFLLRLIDTRHHLKFINLGGVTQFRLRFALDDNNDFGADFLKIFSGNAEETDRQQLIIEYYLP